MPRFTVHDLAATIDARAASGGEASYTRKLLDKGAEHCAKKLGEEAVETVIAAIENDRDHLIAESADLLFHLLVLLKARGVKLEEVEAALGATHHDVRDWKKRPRAKYSAIKRRRHGYSGTGTAIQSISDLYARAVGAIARRHADDAGAGRVRTAAFAA